MQDTRAPHTLVPPPPVSINGSSPITTEQAEIPSIAAPSSPVSALALPQSSDMSAALSPSGSCGIPRARSGQSPIALANDVWPRWSDPFKMQAKKVVSRCESVQTSPLGTTVATFPTLCHSPKMPQFPTSSHLESEQLELFGEDSEDEQPYTINIDEDEDFASGSSSASSSDMERSYSSSSAASTSSSYSMATTVDGYGDVPDDCLQTTSCPATGPVKLQPSQSTFPYGPFTFPSPTPPSQLVEGDLQSCLRFATADGSDDAPEDSAPPAFFPSQRLSFTPQLKIKTAGGIPLALGSSGKNGKRDGIAGMMLGVTGTVEIIDTEKSKRAGKQVIKSSRMIADFATDLTNGLRIWRRDSYPVVKEKLRLEKAWREERGIAIQDLYDSSWEEMLAPGTYTLPLSMKIPCSEKLPPSFESAHYRIRYTMSLALLGSKETPDGKPEILHIDNMPFHILPSTLPTPPPQIPILTHDGRRGGFLAGISRALSISASTLSGLSWGNDKTCTHIVCPSLPTSTFSPGGVIPITLRIADCPTEPTDLYIRLSLVRKVFVRDSAYEMLNEWSLPTETFMEEFCQEEEEIVSRWGYVPYAIRAQEGATPGSKAQVIISDINLPVGGSNGEWTHGYSSHLDLGPTPCPSMRHGECSWFSPALGNKAPVKSDYERYLHTSARHYVNIEVGFAPANLEATLAEIGDCIPEMDIPHPNAFTQPRSPQLCSVTGLSKTNPFPESSSSRLHRLSGLAFQHSQQLPSFPGKLKEISIPVTIGSVAEPQMSCLAGRTLETFGSAPATSVIPDTPAPLPTPASTPEESAERAARDLDESEAERYERVGDDGEEPWLYPPPSYTAAVSAVPAYV